MICNIYLKELISRNILKKIKIIVFALIILGIPGFFLGKKFFRKKEIRQDLNSEFSTSSVINIDKRNYECDFSHFSGKTNITINKPESIKGMSIEWNNGKQKISMDNLTKNYDSYVFPENSFINLVVKILDNLSSTKIEKINDDERYQTFKGSIDSTEFEITAEKSKILEIFIKSKNAKITFD